MVDLKFGIVIPAHNEEKYLSQTLESLTCQSLMPWRIVVVNDQSSDNTPYIAEHYAQKYPFISCIHLEGNAPHSPGAKVVETFYQGLPLVADADILCKFDADLIFPNNYLQRLNHHFQSDPKLGMCGGFCYILKNHQWVMENLTNKDHLRGPIKAYRKACFQSIGGLKKAMGWDTVDELLARFHQWEVKTDKELKVKHLRPTGSDYRSSSHLLQGQMFYTLHYGWILGFLACWKLAFKKKSFHLFLLYVKGYGKAQWQRIPFLVSPEEGKWIRRYRYQGILRRLFSRFL